MSSGTFTNPRANKSQHKRRFYLDGPFPTWVHPGIAASSRPSGSVFPPPSDMRKTLVDPSREIPGSLQRGREGRGFAPSLVGDPWGTEDPGARQGSEEWFARGDSGEAKMQGVQGGEGKPHMPNPDSRTERQTSGNLLTHFDATRLKGLAEDVYATSPVAAFFWGLAAIWLINQVFIKEDRIRRSTRTVASGAARAGRAPANVATGAASGGIDAINQAVSGAVDAVEGVVG